MQKEKFDRIQYQFMVKKNTQQTWNERKFLLLPKVLVT